MKNDKILFELLNDKHDIQDNLWGKTIFSDPEIKKNFLINSTLKSKKKDLVSNLIILLGYFAFLMYIILSFFRIIHLIIWIIFFFSH